MSFSDALVEAVKEAGRDKDKNKNPDVFHPLSFEEGAEWAQKWVSEKGVGHLRKWLNDVERKRTEKLEGVIRFCAGLISTMDQFKDQHPETVLDWIYENASEGQGSPE